MKPATVSRLSAGAAMPSDDGAGLRVSSRADGKHDVVDQHGIVVAADFATHSAAWSWIDRNTDEGREDSTVLSRIRAGYSVRLP